MKETELRPIFRRFLLDNGFEILQEHPNLSPDFIVEKDSKRIGIELKGIRPSTDFATALGQLLFAKFRHNVEENWLYHT